jgi:hypothetical protein
MKSARHTDTQFTTYRGSGRLITIDGSTHEARTHAAIDRPGSTGGLPLRPAPCAAAASSPDFVPPGVESQRRRIGPASETITRKEDNVSDRHRVRDPSHQSGLMRLVGQLHQWLHVEDPDDQHVAAVTDLIDLERRMRPHWRMGVGSHPAFRHHIECVDKQ